MFQPHSSQCWDLGLAVELTTWALRFEQKALGAGRWVTNTWGSACASPAPSHHSAVSYLDQEEDNIKSYLLRGTGLKSWI